MEDGLYDACGLNVCHAGPLIIGYQNDLYVGNVFKEIDSVYSNGIAKWDGQDWHAVGGSLNGDNGQAAAWGGCVYDDKLYVVGTFRVAEGDTCNSVAYWDGVKWHGLAFPADLFFGETPLNYRCVFYKDELYVGGNCYNDLGGGINRDIAKFDGTTWKQVGMGLFGGDSNIWEMVVYKNELYICGYFRAAAGNAGNKIMRWDGAQWNDVSGGLCSSADIAVDMMVYNDKLYVVGIFNCVGNGLPANNIATWDGERWCSFGNSTFNNKISSIAEYEGEIYVGGGFTEVDGQPCHYFAKYVGDHSTDTCSAPILAAPEPSSKGFKLWPNPATDMLQLQAPEPIEAVWVFDATGRQVYRESVPGERVGARGGFEHGLVFCGRAGRLEDLGREVCEGVGNVQCPKIVIEIICLNTSYL